MFSKLFAKKIACSNSQQKKSSQDCELVLQYEKIEPSRSNNNDVFLPGHRATGLACRLSKYAEPHRIYHGSRPPPPISIRFRTSCDQKVFNALQPIEEGSGLV